MEQYADLPSHGTSHGTSRRASWQLLRRSVQTRSCASFGARNDSFCCRPHRQPFELRITTLPSRSPEGVETAGCSPNQHAGEITAAWNVGQGKVVKLLWLKRLSRVTVRTLDLTGVEGQVVGQCSAMVYPAIWISSASQLFLANTITAAIHVTGRAVPCIGSYDCMWSTQDGLMSAFRRTRRQGC